MLRKTLPKLAPLAVLTLVAFTVIWRGGKSLESTWLLVAVALACTFHTAVMPKLHAQAARLWYWLVSVFFIVITIISYVTSSTANYGVDEVLRTAALILIMLWTVRIMSTQKPLVFFKKLSNTVSITTIAACIIGIFVYTLQPVNRFVGTFFDYRFHTDYWPNAWAEYLLLAWPLLVWSYIHVRKKKLWQSNWLWLTGGVVLGCFLLSYSRASLIALIGQLLLWALLLLRSGWLLQHWKKIILLTIKVLAVAIVTFTLSNTIRSQLFPVQSVSDKITFSAAEGTSSIAERYQFWSQSWQLLQQKPLTGWGPYSFRFVQPSLQEGILATSDHPHNVFLKIATERGVYAGLALLALLLIPLLLFIWTFIVAPLPATAPATYAFIGVIGTLAHNLVDYNLQFVAIALLSWLLIGVVVAQVLSANRSVKHDYMFPYAEVIIAICLFIFAVFEGSYLVTSSLARRAEIKGESSQAERWYNLSQSQLFTRDLHLSMAQQFLRDDQPEKALAALDSYYEQNPEDARQWKQRGDVCMKQKNWVCALQSYELAYNRNRFNDMSAINAYVQLMHGIGLRGDFLDRQAEFDDLIQRFNKAIASNVHYISLSHNPKSFQELLAFMIKQYPDRSQELTEISEHIDVKIVEASNQLTSRQPGVLW